MNAQNDLNKFNGLLGALYRKMGAELLLVDEVHGHVHCTITDVSVHRCADGDYAAHIHCASAAGEFNGGHAGLDPDDFNDDWDAMIAHDAEHCHDCVFCFFSNERWLAELEAFIVSLKEV